MQRLPRPTRVIYISAALLAIPALVMLAGSLFVLVGALLGADAPGRSVVASIAVLALAIPLLIAEYCAIFRRSSGAAFWLGVVCLLAAMGGFVGGGVFEWAHGLSAMLGQGALSKEYHSWWQLLTSGAAFCSIAVAGVGHLLWCRALSRPE